MNGNGKKIEFIGESAAAEGVRQQIQMVAGTDATVLITGPTGSGKEVVAALIHQASPRSKHSFIGVNCAGITETLAEAELFGHEKGAFTGAAARRQGYFEAASQGTIFLDEIGEMPIGLQPKLLRVLQEAEFQRLGNPHAIPADFRLIAATNGDLEALCREGKFRRDLFYRLNVFPIQMPSLCDRRDDIPLFVQHFMREGVMIANETMEILMKYSWPGNIRELRNVLERAVIVAGSSERITPKHILVGFGGFGSGVDPVPAVLDQGFSMIDYLSSIERELLRKAQLQASGNDSAGAKLLRLQRTTFISKLQAYGLK